MCTTKDIVHWEEVPDFFSVSSGDEQAEMKTSASHMVKGEHYQKMRKKFKRVRKPFSKLHTSLVKDQIFKGAAHPGNFRKNLVENLVLNTKRKFSQGLTRVQEKNYATIVTMKK